MPLQQVKIVGEHPHSGTYGTIKVDKHGKVKIVKVVGRDMVLINLQSDTGITHCYARLANIKVIGG